MHSFFPFSSFPFPPNLSLSPSPFDGSFTSVIIAAVVFREYQVTRGGLCFKMSRLDKLEKETAAAQRSGSGVPVEEKVFPTPAHLNGQLDALFNSRCVPMMVWYYRDREGKVGRAACPQADGSGGVMLIAFCLT